ncbi:MAG: hypothetical protein U0704_13355 [Candidatus Eisenbacteria bacterium]
MSRTLRAFRGAAVAIAMAAPLAFAPAGPLAVPALAKAPEPLRFANVAWGASRAQALEKWAKQGWRLRLPDERGRERVIARVWGRSADLLPEYDARGALAAVTLKFFPESEGDARALYDTLVTRLTALHGPPAETIAPARPPAREWVGRERRLLAREPLTAAALWVSPAEDAAAVQLDAEQFVWVRYESRAWALAHADTAAAPR